MPEMNLSEYARHRGVTRGAVQKIVRAGKVPLIVDEDGNKLIDAEAADKALAEARERINTPDDQPVGGLTRAKTKTELYRGRLSRLEYEERVGKLLRVDDVRLAMEVCAEAIVRDLERLPARAEDFAAAYTAGQVSGLRVALREAVRGIRKTLAETMRAKINERSESFGVVSD